MKSLFVLLVLPFLLVSCHSFNTQTSLNTEKYIVNGAAQGTYYTVTYYDSLGRKLDFQIDSLLKAFDLSASNYNDSSIISKVNRNSEVILDDIFIGNFQLAQQVSEMTDGAFDITVRPLVELWGFGKKDIQQVDSAEVDSVLQFIGFNKVSLINGKIVKSDLRVQLDFNAIAQGYSVDVIGKYLKSLGIHNFLVDVGGEVLGSGNKIDGSNWQVGVERPKENEAYGESLTAIISLKNKALATSGNYRKFYEKEGVKYSHTINPKTGYPVRSILLSVTVIADNAAFADAMATAFMVIGLENSIKLLDLHPEIDAFLIFSDEKGNYNFFQTKGLEGLVKSN